MLSALLMVAVFTSADTTFVFAEDRRDMTGDSLDEHMVLLASGNPADSLLMTFRIEGQGWVLYSHSFVVDRLIGYDAGRHVAQDEEWEDLLEFYRNFFADGEFEAIGAFAKHGYVRGQKPPVHIEILRQAKVRSLEIGLVESGMSAPEAERQARRGSWEMQHDTAAALQHWERMVISDVPVFRYSTGWDQVYHLAWSDELGQFVNLFPCC